MDIRNWFTSPKASKDHLKNGSTKKESKKNKRRIEDSDSEGEIQVKKKKNSIDKKVTPESKRSKKQIVSSDDDDCDIITPTPPKKKQSPKKQPTLFDAVRKQKEKAPTLKHSTVSDFFGSAPIQRSLKKESPKLPLAKKLEKNHEDKDFLKTLEQLEEPEIVLDTPVEKKKKKLEAKEEEIRKPSPRRKNLKKTSLDIEIIKTPKQVQKIIVEPSPPEKKKAKRSGGGSANYMSYLHREGPKSLGSKEVPEGEPDCLKGKTFIMTGILESFERDEVKDLIEKYGGHLMTTLSKKTNYIIIGRDAGPSKLTKAEQFGTIQLDEDGFLDLIRDSPGSGPKKATKIVVAATTTNIESDDPFENFRKKSKEKEDSKAASQEVLKEEKEIINEKSTRVSPLKKASPAKKTSDEPVQPSQSGAGSKSSSLTAENNMWVDKYRPASTKQIIGQQGAESNVKKLSNWICNWERISKNKRNFGAGRWNTKDDGSGFKAALLSGPPGVGKTTTAHLVCKEAGFDFIELNASDTRSKKSLQNVVSELLLNQSLSNCFSGSNSGKVTKKHIIVMDEVDGMAGNEDRGGIQELIGFIKMTKIPIICICNDRNHPKIRSLSNHCFDLRFQRPRVEQIKAAMMSIAFKEGVRISPEALQNVIAGSNQDIRQTLHNLSLWSSTSSGLTGDQAKRDVGKGTKDIKMGPFDVLREIFQIGMNKKATLRDKSDLFFHDYSILPLFVHENYPQVMPNSTGGSLLKHLNLLDQTAKSICIGDHIEKLIRSRSAWGLLPTQAIFSTVIPGELLTGHLKQMINFPAWLGKNSNRNHMDRVLQELQMHMRMRITGNKTDIALEYLPLLKRALTKPLTDKGTDGVRDVLNVMNHYFLLREDFDNIMELSTWSDQKDPRKQIDSKVKSAFTRTYNKESSQNPYSVPSVTKKKKAAKNSDDALYEDGDGNSSENDSEEDEKIENDGMIKVKKTAKATSSDSSKGKGNAKTTVKKGKTKK